MSQSKGSREVRRYLGNAKFSFEDDIGRRAYGCESRTRGIFYVGAQFREMSGRVTRASGLVWYGPFSTVRKPSGCTKTGTKFRRKKSSKTESYEN